MPNFFIEDFNLKSDWLLGKSEKFKLADLVSDKLAPQTSSTLSHDWIKCLVSLVDQQKQLMITCEIYNDTSRPMDLCLLKNWPEKTVTANFNDWKKRFRVSEKYAIAISAILGIGPPDDDPFGDESQRLLAFREWFDGNWKSWTKGKAEEFFREYEEAFRAGNLHFPKRITGHLPANLKAVEDKRGQTNTAVEPNPAGIDVEPEKPAAKDPPETTSPGPPQRPADSFQGLRGRILRKKGLAAMLLAGTGLAVVAPAVVATWALKSTPMPELLRVSDTFAECVPDGGPVSVTWAGGTGAENLDCPANGWLTLTPPAATAAAIQSVAQSDPDLLLQPDILHFGRDTKTVYRPRRSVTELVIARREPALLFKCDGPANTVEILNEAGRPDVYPCSERPRNYVIAHPADARATLVFRDTDGKVLNRCRTLFGHVAQIDLKYPGVCLDTLPEPPRKAPFRPFIETLDTFQDSVGGRLWMRDLFRYGSGARIDPQNVETSIDVLLETVARDTGQRTWRVANRKEVETVRRDGFRPQGGLLPDRLRGIVAGTECEAGGFAKLDLPASGTDLGPGSATHMPRQCNLNAPDFGFWLVRDP